HPRQDAAAGHADELLLSAAEHPPVGLRFPLRGNAAARAVASRAATSDALPAHRPRDLAQERALRRSRHRSAVDDGRVPRLRHPRLAALPQEAHLNDGPSSQRHPSACSSLTSLGALLPEPEPFAATLLELLLHGVARPSADERN